MKKILLYIWQLPQHIVALIAIKITKAYKTEVRNGTWYAEYWCYDCESSLGGSYGQYLLVPCKATQILKDHEYGHCPQSMWWGPFYLPIVGLPSVVLNWMVSKGKLTNAERNAKWPENQADRFGKVVR